MPAIPGGVSVLALVSLGLHRGVGEVPMCLRRLGGGGRGGLVCSFRQLLFPSFAGQYYTLNSNRFQLAAELWRERGACVSVSVPVRPYPLNCLRVLAEEPGSVTTKRESDVVSIWFLLHMGLVKIC